MSPLTWEEIAEAMGWNAVVSQCEADRDPGGLAARVMRVAELAADRARQDYERERARHAVPFSEKRRIAIDALVGDALTGRKADHICEREGYEVTGVILTKDDGRACLVNRSAVRWLQGERDLHELMFPNHRPDPVAAAVAAEREACAKICEENADRCRPGSTLHSVLSSNAAAIRARGAA